MTDYTHLRLPDEKIAGLVVHPSQPQGKSAIAWGRIVAQAQIDYLLSKASTPEGLKEEIENILRETDSDATYLPARRRLSDLFQLYTLQAVEQKDKEIAHWSQLAIKAQERVDTLIANEAQAKEQARKEGRQEIIDFVNKEGKRAYIYEGTYTHDTSCDNQLLLDLGDWQAKLKEWGIE